MRPFPIPLALLLAAPAAAQVQEVIITATPLRESSLETAQPTAVVAGEELLGRRAPSLGETLESQPGLSSGYFGPQASRPIVRGLGGERVQVYLDGGDSLDVAALSSDHAVAVDPLLAHRIEVVRGPATLLYGNSASAGLINVVTERVPARQPERGLEGALELRGDSALEERALGARLDGGGGGFAFHADAFRRDTGDVAIPGYAWSSTLRAERAAAGEPVDERRDRLASSASEALGGALGGAWLGDAARAGLAISRFETDYGIPPSAPEESGTGIEVAQTRYDFDSELREPLPGVTALRARASYSDYEHREVEPDGALGTIFFLDGREIRVALDHAAIRGWRGTVGVQWRSLDFAALGEEAFVPASRTRNTGVFAFEERPLGPVTLELGARLERQDIDPDPAAGRPDYGANAWSGSGGVLWKPAGEWSLALQLTSTQRHPTATELHASGPHLAVQRYEIGDATLDRERALTADLTLRKHAGDWQLALTAFRSEYSDFIFTSLTGAVQDELPEARYLQEDARLSGVEAEIALPALERGAARLETRLLFDAVRGTLEHGGNLPQIPPRRAGIELDFERGRLGAGLALMRYADQERLAREERPTPGYTRLDVDLFWRVPLGQRRLLLFLLGRNLLDEEARRHASPLKDFAPLPGRSLAGGARFEF